MSVSWNEPVKGMANINSHSLTRLSFFCSLFLKMILFILSFIIKTKDVAFHATGKHSTWRLSHLGKLSSSFTSDCYKALTLKTNILKENKEKTLPYRQAHILLTLSCGASTIQVLVHVVAIETRTLDKSELIQTLLLPNLLTNKEKADF